jgi:hypothetical protein
MGLLKQSRALWLAIFVAGAPACAADWELGTDLRAVSSDGRESFSTMARANCASTKIIRHSTRPVACSLEPAAR